VHMLTVLTVLLSLLSLTHSCSPIVSGDKVLRTAQSVQNGAHYLKSLKEYNATSCFAGCCDLKDCDTVMHTGTKLTKRDTNCFYFNCDGHCVFNSSSSRSIKVATFPLYTSPLPELDSLVEPSAAPNATLVIAKETTATNTTSPEEGYHMDADTVTDLVSSDQKESNTTQTDAKPETVEKAEGKPEEADKTDEKTMEKATVEKATVEKATEKSEEKVTEKTEAKSEEKTEEKTEDKVEETPKESEKPSTASSPVITSNTTLNSTIAKESTKIDYIPENKPAITVPQPKIVTQPKVVTEPKKEEEEEKKEEEKEKSMVNEVPALLHPTVNKSGEKSGEKDTNVKIEVKIDSTTDDMTGGLVFWVALALGAGLVSFGMITVCRCYTKKRRLYSALADDYLINGMYSI